MAALAKGKLSYYVLSCLAERDMYGLELIEEIKKRFNIDIKLPSLYSNLNRMKELKFVSTYLKESNKGPKCSYSSITVKGRNELESLKEQWANDLLSTLPEKVEKEIVEEKALEEEKTIKPSDETSTNEDYDDYFSIPTEEESTDNQKNVAENKEIDEVVEEIEEPLQEVEEVQKSENIQEIEEIQEETESISFTNNAEEIKQISELKEEYFQPAEQEAKKDDYAQFTENKKLFDITQDFSKYKKKKSYTENQMVMNVNTSSPLHNEEKKQNDVTSLKQTLVNSRDGNYEPIDRFAEKENSNEEVPTIAQNLNNEYKKFNEETKDDGLFITERIPQSEIPKAQKIELSKLSFTIQNEYSKMPAPNRNSSLDPSCRDVKARLQKLYEKTTVKKEEEQKTFREYETLEQLKDYYEAQDINFKIYDKPEARARHNTNKLLFFTELMLLGLTGLASLLFYFIFNAVGGVNNDLSFLYYLFPVISLVMVVYKYYNFRLGVSRVPKPMLKTLIIWIIFLLGSIAIFCFSIVCGLNLRLAVTYCTCIIYPILILGILLVARHYLTIWIYKKYWR